jgi:hypothetical protein
VTIVPRPRDALERAVSTSSGPFRVALSSVALRPNFGFRAKPIVRVGLGISAEPRLRPLFLKYSLGDFTLESPESLKLEAFSPHARVELPVQSKDRHVEVRMDFMVPPLAPPPEQVELTGKFVMETAAGTEQIRFRDLSRAEGVARRRGGVTVKLERVQFRRAAPLQHDLTIRVSVSYDAGGPAFESHRTWMLHNEVFLETDRTARIPHQGPVQTLRQGEGTLAVEYSFKGLAEAPEDYRFVYVAPVLLINVPIEFELKGIPVFP